VLCCAVLCLAVWIFSHPLYNNAQERTFLSLHRKPPPVTIPEKAAYLKKSPSPTGAKLPPGIQVRGLTHSLTHRWCLLERGW
jgi:hypothetical protein